MKNKSRWILILSVTLIGLGLVWHWIHGYTSLPSIRQSQSELRLPILASSALQSLDPIKSVELVQYSLDLQIFERLVSVGLEGEILPALAEKWEISPDFRVWIFRLREARFNDDPCFHHGIGRTVTVDDVLYSWKRGLNPKSGSLNSWALSTSVMGAETFSKGEAPDVIGLEKISDRELRVTLSEPDRDFLARLTVLSTAIVPREAVEYYGDKFDTHPVGTGPFKLSQWEPGEYVLLERNTNYGNGSGWQPSPANIDRVRFNFFRSEAQIASAFANDQLDVRNITGSDLAQLSDLFALNELKARHFPAELVRPGSVCRLHLLAPMIGSDYVFGASAELRRELATSFDHQQLLASAVGPLGQITKSIMLPKGVLVDALDVTNEYQTQTSKSDAKNLLEGRTVKIAYVSSRINDVVIALLRSWIEQRGGKVRLYPSASDNALFASVAETKPDLTLLYWSPYYPNVANYLTALISSSRPVPNFTGFTNQTLDRAANQLKLADEYEGSKLRITIKAILDQEMPWIPLYYDTPLVLVKQNVKNYKINPVSVTKLVDVKLVDDQKGRKSVQ